MLSAIFEELGNVVSGFSTLITSIFSSVVQIFYTAPTGSNTTGSLTIVGTLMLVGLGSGLVIWGFHFVRNLIRLRTK